LRRNMDLKILLFNNHIYGLTKGQYSPTSEFGKVTKSSPVGTIEQPLQPIQIALAAQATFVARTVFNDMAHLSAMLEAMARHRGAAFLEILLNCLVFNPSDLGHLTAPDTREDARILLRHGEKVIFGKKQRMGLVLDGSDPKTVNLEEQPERERDVLTHNASASLPCLAQILASIEPPEYPTVLGIFRAVEKPTYEQLLMRQILQEQERKPARGIRDLLDDNTCWDVP
jgi:2-oxoglutarate ferredoxin oxidoreductase subunit beta